MKKNIFFGLPDTLLKKRKKAAQPAFVPPMLATLTEEYFSNKQWMYEHKFDGERCLAFKKNGKITLKSRNDKIINEEYPELVTALLKQKADNFIIDGEIVSLNEKGISDFELLQGRINLQEMDKVSLRGKKIHISYYLFDLMYVDGYDVRQLPLDVRKQILKNLFTYNKTIHYSKETIGKGVELFKKACKLGWEGIIAKRIEGAYIGKRSRDWLKFKCIMQQELVIGGFTCPKGSRSYFGALLVGYYDHGKLMYAGKVGTGYSEESLAQLGKKLKKIEIKKSPFSTYDESIKDIHWVKPILVAEFQFAQWTRGNKLRVGRYKGLRDDKSAKDVVKEVPKAIGPEG